MTATRPLLRVQCSNPTCRRELRVQRDARKRELIENGWELITEGEVTGWQCRRCAWAA